ncbi:MAG TPA: hypothetical protein PLJ35_05230 [Anaerolineae bacterium]|nr:hypothetical protein [Anaerolineae bacterium]
MLEWLKGLTEEQRMLIVGLIAQYVVQLEKLVCAKLKWNIEEAKLTKLTMAAVTTGLAALVINGIEPAFWKEWLLAFISAVVLHEVGGKVVRKADEVIDEALAATAMPYLLLGTLALAFCLCAPPAAAQADPGWDWSLKLESGFGTTFINDFDFTVAVGARVGKFPDATPVVGGHEFGVDLANVGGHWAAGPWLRLVDNLSLVGYIWQEDRRATGDLALRYTAPFRW